MEIINFHTLDSTNDYIKKRVHFLKHFTVINALRQTKGRGRKDHQWISSPHDLTFSIFYKEERNPIQLSLIMALSIIRILKSYNLNATIKWPNDIYIDDHKVAGILTEVIYNPNYKGTVIGVGINIKNNHYQNINIPLSNKNFLNTILLKYNELLNQNYDDLLIEINHLSYLKDKIVNDPIYGPIKYKKLLKDGRVCIENAKNQQLFIYINEISLGNVKKTLFYAK